MSWSSPPPAVLPPNQDRHWLIDVVGGIGCALATFLVACRLFTRVYLIRAADWGDAVLAFSATLGIVTTALQISAGAYGAGRHIYYLTEPQIQQASLLGTVAVPFGQMAMAFPKITAAAVLIRIAGPSARTSTKYYLYGITIFFCLLSAVYCTIIFVQCTPAFALWTNVPDAKCWPGEVVAIFGIVTSVFSAFVDLNLTIYPIIIIYKLNMDLKKKINICVLMGLGSLATICAAFKIPHLKDQVSKDVTWDIVALVCWSLSEMNVLLMAASIPLLRPLWLWLRNKPITASTSGGSTAGKRFSKRGVAGYGSNKKGFVNFGSKKDTHNDMTIEIGLEETGSPHEARALKTPPLQPADNHIHVKRDFTVSHEEV